MTIGENIKKARKQAGLTQKELGEKLGVTASAIGQFEKSDNMKSETIDKIASVLNLPTLYLIYGDAENYNGEALQHDPNYDLSTHDKKIYKTVLESLNTLNADGIQKILTYSDDIAGNPKYKKNNDK